MKTHKISLEIRKQLTERSGGRCEIVIDGIRCSNPATSPHHKKSRARGGNDDLNNLIDTCFSHHRAIEDHKGEWTKQYRTYSWQKEGETESIYREVQGGLR